MAVKHLASLCCLHLLLLLDDLVLELKSSEQSQLLDFNFSLEHIQEHSLHGDLEEVNEDVVFGHKSVVGH